MPYFPYTHLVLRGRTTVIVTGPHFQLLNTCSGEVLHTTTRLVAGDRTANLAETQGPIRCIAVDSTVNHIATTGDDKKLKVWKVTDSLELISERELPKKPTEIAFTRDGQTILVSDKFGDVFSYSLHPTLATTPSNEIAGASKRGSLTSHENHSSGTLVLGHASLLTTFLLTPDERFIVTADRDEHIRVSWYPQGYAVERYCLGHEKYVSAVHIPSFQHSVLVSGGGDPMLKVWDWMSGKLLANIAVFETVEPYIKVYAPKRRRGCGDVDDEGDGEDGQKQQKGKGRGRRSRGRKKQEARDDSADAEETIGEAAADEERGQPDDDAPADHKGETNTTSGDDVVFVVRRIRSVDRGEHGRFIIFSVVGATALLYVSLPGEGKSASTAVVHAVDLGVPVIDFTIGQDDAVWVLTDAEWKAAPIPPSDSPQFVKLLSWSDGTLSESTLPVLTALNSNCLLAATPQELKTLDLYSALSSMPKNVDPDHDPLIRDTLSEAAAVDPDTEGKQLTQRELGRLKKKKALLAKIQEKEKETAKRGPDDLEAGTEAEGGQKTKKTRSDGGMEEQERVEAHVQDVDMDAS